jgi:hypothetical protein
VIDSVTTENRVSDNEVSEKPGKSLRVVHWAKYWIGKPASSPPSYRYTWVEQPGEIEVSIQQYGEPRWIEQLYVDMIETGQEILGEIAPEFDAVRLRVTLYTHQPDNRNYKFTLEHVERR